MAINLSRNTRLWVSTVDSTKAGAPAFTPSNTWEIGLLEGFTLSQSTSSSDVSLNEAGATPTRGSRRFNDALDPVEWSFSTYIRPTIKATVAGVANGHFLADAIMWQALASPLAPTFGTATSAVESTNAGMKVHFKQNSAHELLKLYLYFKIDASYYLVKDAQVSQADISVDIEDIGQVAWSGQATDLVSVTATEFPDTGEFMPIPPAANDTYIKNKLTIMSVTTKNADALDGTVFPIPITSGSITINNNITYLIPSTLSTVDKPIGSFTGNFEVTGSFEAYLRDGATGSKAFLDYYQTFVAPTNSNEVVITLGGSNAPKVIITLPNVQVGIPELSVDDVVSTSVEFKAIPVTSDMNDGQEIDLLAVASYVEV